MSQTLKFKTEFLGEFEFCPVTRRVCNRVYGHDIEQEADLNWNFVGPNGQQLRIWDKILQIEVSPLTNKWQAVKLKEYK